MQETHASAVGSGRCRFSKNPDSYQVGVLSNVLRAMFERDERVSVGELETGSISKLVDSPSGVVDYGSSFHAASDEAPLAFARLAVPTTLRVCSEPCAQLILFVVADTIRPPS